jgi:hypothetical protein
MLVLNHKQLAEEIIDHYKQGTALLVQGGIGIGKSEVMREASKQIANNHSPKLHFVEWNKLSLAEKKDLLNSEKLAQTFIFSDIRASQIDPSDLRGIPDLNHGSEYLLWKQQLLFTILANPKAKGVLFFDEINTAPSTIQNSLMQIILDKCIGELPISEGVLRIGAGNRTEDRASIFDIPAPLKERFGMVELAIPEIDSWIEWAVKHDVDTRIITYLKFQPQFLYKFEPKGKDKNANPRSWVFLSKHIREIENNYDKIFIKAGQFVGEGIASQFTAYCKLARKIDIDELIKNPAKMKDFWEKAKEIDIKYAVVSGVSEKYRQNPKLFDSVATLTGYIEPEFAILLLRIVKEMNPNDFRKHLADKGFREILSKYGKYFDIEGRE